MSPAIYGHYGKHRIPEILGILVSATLAVPVKVLGQKASSSALPETSGSTASAGALAALSPCAASSVPLKILYCTHISQQICLGNATTSEGNCPNADIKCLCQNNDYISNVSCCFVTYCNPSAQECACDLCPSPRQSCLCSRQPLQNLIRLFVQALILLSPAFSDVLITYFVPAPSLGSWFFEAGVMFCNFPNQILHSFLCQHLFPDSSHAPFDSSNIPLNIFKT